MPVVSRFYGISIYFYISDHPPPHFHAIYGEFEASFVIETCEILDGEVPPRIRRLVQEWAEIHQEELMENWQRARTRQEMLPITPLS